MRPYSYHNHSRFCDGSNTVDEMVEGAITLGLDEIGFSSHSYLEFDRDFSMPLERLCEYKAAVRSAAERYKDKIKVLLAIEQDINSDPEAFAKGFDYKLGSVHNLKLDGNFYSVERGPDDLKRTIDTVFGGDAYALCEAYFDTVARVKEITGCDIVGHFDYIVRENKNSMFFDETNERYLAAARRAIERLVADGAIFEINTGGIARGYIDRPYPSITMLKMINEAGGSVTFSSDCHRARDLGCWFDEAVEMAKECGFEGFMRYTDEGFVLVPFER